jgi:guanosine-3',5'-bis(diphosphate) 3'-pyrophosphohydrolase
MMPDTQTIYQKTILFAARRHEGQTVTNSDIPYLVHVANVAMEILIASQHTEQFDVGFAVQLAFLHDTLEDTTTTSPEVADEFGMDVANGVQALTKNARLPKDEQMPDSLSRIRQLRPEVWSVKLADRITNLQPPPGHWDNAKKTAYRQEAGVILQTLKGGNAYLEDRLAKKIADYAAYLDPQTQSA